PEVSDDLVIVAHFGVILMAVQRALGCAPREVLGHPIPNLSVTRIERAAAGWRVGPIGQRL
ncbi:MAG: histidine phosphatase family protein, partial [Alphaproteobacteria bacterium]